MTSQEPIVEFVDRLGRIETKLDTALSTLQDHETRIRDVEQKKEDCIQDTRLGKIETNIDKHDTRIKCLEDTHQQDTGGKNYLTYLIMVLLALLNVWQFAQGVIK